MNKAEYFTDLKTRLIEANRAQKKAISELQDFDKKADKDLSKALAQYPFRVLTAFQSGCALEDWEPSVTLIPKTNGYGLGYMKVKGRGWLWVKPSDLYGQVYPHQIVSPQPPAPFDMASLEASLKELSEEWGVAILPHENELAKAMDGEDGNYPRNADDLLLLHPGGKIEAHGSISYMGWDCRDDWYLVSHEGKLTLYYGTSGHGFGMDHKICHNESLAPFLELMNDQNHSISNRDLFKSVVDQFRGSFRAQE